MSPKIRKIHRSSKIFEEFQQQSEYGTSSALTCKAFLKKKDKSAHVPAKSGTGGLPLQTVVTVSTEIGFLLASMLHPADSREIFLRMQTWRGHEPHCSFRRRLGSVKFAS